MDINGIRKTIFGFVVLSGFACGAFAGDQKSLGREDVRVHILSKYHPDEVVVVIDDETVRIGADSKLPVILSSGNNAGFTLRIPPRDVERRYQGRLEIHQGNEELLLINEVPFLSYVASATIGESGWVEEEAMKAQAVLVATNALRRQRQARKGAAKLTDISDLAYHQVYPGHNPYVGRFLAVLKEMTHLPLLQIRPAEDIRELQVQSKLVDAVFHAECGRRIFSAKEIWGEDHVALKSLFFDDDLPAGDSWLKIIQKDTIDEIFSVSYGHYAIQNRGDRLVVRVNNDVYGIDEFRLSINRKLGWNTIESNDFEINMLPDEIVFSGYGRGHGVGLCQVQSNYLAKTGWKFGDILSYFYPSAALL